MMNLTEKQAEVFEFIKTSLIDSHNTPSVREIARKFQVSTRCMQERIGALEKKGYIARAYLGGRYKLVGYDLHLKRTRRVH